MFGYPKLRKATISAERREVFERVGVQGIQLMLAGGWSPTEDELRVIYQNTSARQDAQMWLTEQADRVARHEHRSEFVEWAILVLVGMEVVFDFLRLFGLMR